jgi:hypothetical protein
MQIVARISALMLLLGVIVLIITGYGITQTGVIFSLSHGLIDRRASDLAHRATNLPLAFFFLAHIFANIKIALYKRRPTENWLINGLMIAAVAAAMVGVAYMEYFRKGG